MIKYHKKIDEIYTGLFAIYNNITKCASYFLFTTSNHDASAGSTGTRLRFENPYHSVAHQPIPTGYHSGVTTTTLSKVGDRGLLSKLLKQ